MRFVPHSTLGLAAVFLLVAFGWVLVEIARHSLAVAGVVVGVLAVGGWRAHVKGRG